MSKAYDFLLEGAIHVPFCFINWFEEATDEG